MSAEIEAIARAWMAHQGYTRAEIAIAEQSSHQQYGCEHTGQGYDCADENGKSLHPVWDALDEACDMARVAVEALESIGYLCAERECDNPDHYELRA